MKRILLLLFLSSILLIISNIVWFHREIDPKNATHKFEKALQGKSALLEIQMQELKALIITEGVDKLFTKDLAKYSTLLDEEGMVLLVYANDSLKFWTDNTVAVENKLKEVCLDNNIAQLRNGIFLVKNIWPDNIMKERIVGLVLIKNTYPFQNNYLENNFFKTFGLPSNTAILPQTEDNANTFPVKDISDNTLFSLSFKKETSMPQQSLSVISLMLALLGFVIFFAASGYFGNHLAETEGWKNTIVWILLPSTLFLVAEYFQFPAAFFKHHLLAQQFSTGWKLLPAVSAGTLLFSLFTIILIIKKLNAFKTEMQGGKVLKLVLFLLLLSVSVYINQFLGGIVESKGLYLDFNNIYDLNSFTLLSIGIAGLMMYIFFVLSDRLVQYTGKPDTKLILLLLIPLLLHLTHCYLQNIKDPVQVIWPFLVILAAYRYRVIKQMNMSFSGVLAILALFALISSRIFVANGNKKDMAERQALAQRLAAENDPIAEHLFAELKRKVQNDTVLAAKIKGPGQDLSEFNRLIKQNYFSGYWERYDINIALFDSMCYPIVSSSEQVSMQMPHSYFDELLDKKAYSTPCDSFYFVDDASGKISYLGNLLLRETKSKRFLASLFIELNSRLVLEETGFPDLLLDRKAAVNHNLLNYSYAKYKYGKLIAQYGKYNYPLLASGFNSRNIYRQQGLNHRVFDKGDIRIVVSKEDHGLQGDITVFSYLFAFFCLLMLIILIVENFPYSLRFNHSSFKTRIQALLVLAVMISSLLFGFIALRYMNKQNHDKNKEIITEKLNSVLKEMEEKLGNEALLHPSMQEYVSYLLRKFSGVFFTDISIYDLKGNIYATSAPQLFSQGLISGKMNPSAFFMLHHMGETVFTHAEKIGKLSYMSAYIPFKNKDGLVLAYLNLPYFAKQKQLEKEMSGFLASLINIYLLLFALSLLTAIFISGLVTKPLRLVQEKMRLLSLGGKNELIDWNNNDELGKLVQEYNRMVIELSKSAEGLARSERESAWREMARQVAHEIKNPLTPMKLSIQHMVKSINEGNPDKEQLAAKVKNMSKMLVEQIDTLAHIAGEFSNFAQMPKAINQSIELNALLQSATELYRSEGVTLISTTDPAWVKADKEQLTRVFNNLLKNAFQAVPDHLKADVRIVLEKEKNNFVISIHDNGQGIPEEQKGRIFSPNFTTKNTGMGLGLAMAKNIVESFGGTISFESEPGKGSIFRVTLPLNEQAAGSIQTF